MLDLAFPNQVLHRSGHVFDRHVRIDTVLIEQIDGLDPEPLQRAFDSLFDVFRPAVQARRTGPPIAATEVEPELGSDRHLPAERSESFAHELFV